MQGSQSGALKKTTAGLALLGVLASLLLLIRLSGDASYALRRSAPSEGGLPPETASAVAAPAGWGGREVLFQASLRASDARPFHGARGGVRWMVPTEEPGVLVWIAEPTGGFGMAADGQWLWPDRIHGRLLDESSGTPFAAADVMALVREARAAGSDAPLRVVIDGQRPAHVEWTLGVVAAALLVLAWCLYTVWSVRQVFRRTRDAEASG